jgi:hypothetical protein
VGQRRRRRRLYLHGSDARQQEIADSLSKLAAEELKGRRKGRHERQGKAAIGQRARKGKEAS